MSETKRNDVYAIGKQNPNLPFHPAVRAGDFIFVSGQVAKDAAGGWRSAAVTALSRGSRGCKAKPGCPGTRAPPRREADRDGRRSGRSVACSSVAFLISSRGTAPGPDPGGKS